MLNVIERARKGAFEDTAYGVIDAVKLYYADASLDGKVDMQTFTFPEDTKLKITGEKPKSGSVTLSEDGKVELAVGNGVWCAKKSKDEEKITIVDYSIEDCKIEMSGPDEPSVPATPASCFTVSEDGSEITGYTCEDNDVVIPSTINGIKIVEIGNSAFRQKQLTSVIIPDGITSIGEMVFYNNQLTNIVLPDSVVKMGYGAFWKNQLVSVTISHSLTRIEDQVFNNNQITSIVIPDNIERIGSGAFQNNQLTSITIPHSVAIIGYGAFQNNQLTNIIIQRSENTIVGSPWGATNATIEWTG